MTSDISPETRLIVARRANHVCEYCLIAEQDAYFRFQVEHIISRKHGGSSEIDNLALACAFCNRHKGTDIASTSLDNRSWSRFTTRVVIAGETIFVWTELLSNRYHRSPRQLFA